MNLFPLVPNQVAVKLPIKDLRVPTRTSVHKFCTKCKDGMGPHNKLRKWSRRTGRCAIPLGIPSGRSARFPVAGSFRTCGSQTAGPLRYIRELSERVPQKTLFGRENRRVASVVRG